MRVFESPEVCAKAVQDIAIGLTARPYNFYDLNDLWWLIPSKDWPAYRYGKLAFTGRYTNPDKLFISLNVEKGFGEAAERSFPGLKRDQILRPDWTWNRLVSVAGGQEFERVWSALPNEMQPRLVVCASPVADEPESRHYDSRAYDRLVFDLSDGNLRLVDSQVHAHFLDGIRNLQRFSALAAGLRDLPQSEWVWFDVYAGIQVPRNSEIGIGDVYRQVLSRFTPWLR